jgi:hypothetical protein
LKKKNSKKTTEISRIFTREREGKKKPNLPKFLSLKRNNGTPTSVD